MLISRSTGLAVILPKTIHSCLEDAPALLYNWDEKLRGLILGICLSRSLILQSIAQTRPGRVKTTENNLSAFIGQERMALDTPRKACVTSTLKGMGRRRFFKYRGKMVVIIDSTSYAKTRSRRKIRPMPGKAQVRLHNLKNKETLLVPGYQEIWVGILLAELACRGKSQQLRLLMRKIEKILSLRFAKPPKLTLGRFFQVIAMDFPSPSLAGMIL